MSRQPEVREVRPLRIISDVTFLGMLAAGGFLAVTVLLFWLGWTPRPGLAGVALQATDTAHAFAAAMGKGGAMVVSLALFVVGGAGFLIERAHNLRWLAISLAALSITGMPPTSTWLDFAIVATCALGWLSQFLPARTSHTAQGDVGQGTPSTGHH